MQEEPLSQGLLAFNCQHCHHKANLPVLTPCGHLFCWRCFFLLTQYQDTCSLCGQPVSQDDLYPLFVEHEEREQEPGLELPERPPPINVPKVPNADILSGTDKNTRDNIVMGRPFAGSLFVPSLGVNAFMAMSFVFKLIFAGLLTVLMALWLAQLFV